MKEKIIVFIVLFAIIFSVVYYFATNNNISEYYYRIDNNVLKILHFNDKNNVILYNWYNGQTIKQSYSFEFIDKNSLVVDNDLLFEIEDDKLLCVEVDENDKGKFETIIYNASSEKQINKIIRKLGGTSWEK